VVVAGLQTSISLNEDSNIARGPGRAAEVGRVLVETAAVAVVGAVIAFAANAVSPRGLALARNYFPGAVGASVRPPSIPPAAGIEQNGLQWVDEKQAARLFRDPAFREQRIVFLDARDEEHYREGHIAGAHDFDPYHPEKEIAVVLPLCQAAEKVVVYCNGGDCEDSQFAAIALRDAGIPNERLFVFAGGIRQWITNGLPVESGDGSGGAAGGGNP
jgi:rhodanese-related sulfurtransferase